MTEQEYDEVEELWDSIRKDVCNLMHAKLSAQPLSQDQIQFIYEKCTEDLYHVGWSAVEHITPSKTISNKKLMEVSGTDYDKELKRLENSNEN